MKKITSLIFTLMTAATFAADLYVKEFGGGGAYPTISEAITAANPGDRILVLPKEGNAPYIENLSISKNLQLLSAANGERVYLQGNITIPTSLPAGSHVVIDGMYLTNNGDITAGNSTNPISVTIVNTRLNTGVITLGTNITATIANCRINSNSSSTNFSISFTKGKCVGNEISAAMLGIEVENAASTQDTTYVVGNRVTITGSDEAYKALNWANNGQFFYIANNYFLSSRTGSYPSGTTRSLVQITRAKNGTNSNELNYFINNTIEFMAPVALGVGYIFRGLISTATLTNRTKIMNNFIKFPANSPSSARQGYSIAGSPEINYTLVSGTSGINSGSATVSNTTQYPAVTISVNSYGCPIDATYHNTGHPDPIFTDLDLTRNDAGACGGSYNIEENFPNLGVAGASALVHWMEAPRRILQGGTLTIKAEGHDR